MNKRVLQVSIGLVAFFIIAFCVLKLFFPDALLVCIENKRIIQIGNFIDNHVTAMVFMDAAFAVLAMHFYLSSCKQVWRLEIHHYVLLAIYGVAMAVMYLIHPVVAMITDLILFIVFPIILKSKPKQFIPLFIIHQVGQNALLFIRSQPLYLADTNYATGTLLVLDAYAWLVLYYLYSNMNKEVTIWEDLHFRFSAICQKLNWKKNSKK